MKRRHVLSDEQWAQIEPLLPGRKGDPGRSGKNNRLFVDAVVWLAKTGAPWCDLPERFGDGTPCSNDTTDGANGASGSGSSKHWAATPTWSTCCSTPRLSGASTCGRAKGRRTKPSGVRGGWSTKIHAAVNGQGQPVRFSLTGGECHDMTEAETLLKNLSPKYVIGDKGYDSDPLRQQITPRGQASHSCPQRNPSASLRPSQV